MKGWKNGPAQSRKWEGTLPRHRRGGSAQLQGREGTELQQDSRPWPAVSLGADGAPRAQETAVPELPRSSPRDRLSEQAVWHEGPSPVQLSPPTVSGVGSTLVSGPQEGQPCSGPDSSLWAEAAT